MHIDSVPIQINVPTISLHALCYIYPQIIFYLFYKYLIRDKSRSRHKQTLNSIFSATYNLHRSFRGFTFLDTGLCYLLPCPEGCINLVIEPVSLSLNITGNTFRQLQLFSPPSFWTMSTFPFLRNRKRGPTCEFLWILHLECI